LATAEMKTRLNVGFKAIQVLAEAACCYSTEFAVNAIQIGEDHQDGGEKKYSESIE
jgi:hypothetical protein